MSFIKIDELIEKTENVLRVLNSMDEHTRTWHFNMSYYLADTSCGTIGCAVGHCALDPWFIERGFKAADPETYAAVLPGEERDAAPYPNGGWRSWPEMVDEFFSGLGFKGRGELRDKIGNFQYQLMREHQLSALLRSVFFNGTPRPHAQVVAEIEKVLSEMRTRKAEGWLDDVGSNLLPEYLRAQA